MGFCFFSPKVEKRTSGIEGTGLYAKEAIAAGELIVVKGGHVFDRATRDELAKTLGPSEIQIGDDVFILSLIHICYAIEAARASLAFAYQVLGWTTAISLIDADNLPSQRLAERMGATYESTQQVTDFTAGLYRHLPPEEFLK